MAFRRQADALQHMKETEGMAEIIASLPRNPCQMLLWIEAMNPEPEALEILAQGAEWLAEGGACAT